MAKRRYSPRYGGYLPAKTRKRGKRVVVKAYCRRKPRRKSYARRTDMPF